MCIQYTHINIYLWGIFFMKNLKSFFPTFLFSDNCISYVYTPSFETLDECVDFANDVIFSYGEFGIYPSHFVISDNDCIVSDDTNDAHFYQNAKYGFYDYVNYIDFDDVKIHNHICNDVYVFEKCDDGKTSHYFRVFDDEKIKYIIDMI